MLTRHGAIKVRYIFLMVLVASIFIGYAGLVSAGDHDSKPAKPDQAAQARVIESYGKLPLSFVRNDGQIDSVYTTENAHHKNQQLMS